MADGGEGVCESDNVVQREVSDFLKNAEVTEANTPLDDVVGLSEIKQKFKEHAILPAKFPLLWKGFRSDILIYGPPGVGKTMVLQAVISELLKEKTTCFRVSIYDILSKFIKFPTRIMEAFFTTAIENGRSLIIFEDIEVLCERDDAKIQDLRFSFCYHACNTVRPKKDGEFLIVVGVTNKPWVLTFDIRRRFQYKMYLSMPDDIERCGILRHHMMSVPNDLTDEQFSSLADLTTGFTRSDIVVLAKDASMQPVRKVQLATHYKKVTGEHKNNPEELVDDLLTPCRPDDDDAIEMKWTDIPESKLSPPIVSMDDVLKSLSGMKPSVTDEELQLFKTYQEEYDLEPIS